MNELLIRLAKAIALQFGEDCEVVVHDLHGHDDNDELISTVVAIENGHVSGRKIGDGPSPVVLEALSKGKDIEDKLVYFTTTADGRMLKSTSVFVRDDDGYVTGIFSINYDMTKLAVVEDTVRRLIGRPDGDEQMRPKISSNVNDLLDELIDESVKIVGKPVAAMTKEDKIKAISFLNDAGAFLITKSGDKVSKYFGISKFTLYNYMDIKNRNAEADDDRDSQE